jgi:malate dehydrogenase (oxaloacetate-decarboxylating)(NADP+)
LSFGKDYIIPKPFDPRLMACVSGAVAEAAKLQPDNIKHVQG